MGDPSGAARAPQTTDELVAQVRETLRDLGDAAFYSQARMAAKARYDAKAPEWLGALVQAVEDQQRERDVWADQACRSATESHQLETLVAQLRADDQRLRDKFHDLSLELGDKECDFQSAAGRANAAEAELSRIRGLAAQATDAEIDAIITAGERWSRETVHDLGEVSRRQMVRHVLQAALAPPGDAP